MKNGLSFEVNLTDTYFTLSLDMLDDFCRDISFLSIDLDSIQYSYFNIGFEFTLYSIGFDQDVSCHLKVYYFIISSFTFDTN